MVCVVEVVVVVPVVVLTVVVVVVVAKEVVVVNEVVVVVLTVVVVVVVLPVVALTVVRPGVESSPEPSPDSSLELPGAEVVKLGIVVMLPCPAVDGLVVVPLRGAPMAPLWATRAHRARRERVKMDMIQLKN